MKKNKMMRIASGLLILTLLTTCVISGTFAKYTTASSASDEARVAKWGVELSVGGNLYSKTYKAATGDTVTVESSDSDNLVAPGTSSEKVKDDGTTGKMEFSISGTPEVTTQVTVNATGKSVFLKGGEETEYKDWTKDSELSTARFTLEEDYYPVKYTLTKGDTKVVEDKPLSEVIAYLNGLSGTYKPGSGEGSLSKIAGSYALSWKWDFSQNDQADTFLGQLAVNSGTYGKPLVNGTDYNLNEEFGLSISITQVD